MAAWNAYWQGFLSRASDDLSDSLELVMEGISESFHALPGNGPDKADR